MDIRDSSRCELAGAGLERELQLVRAKRKALQREFHGSYTSVSIQLQQVSIREGSARGASSALFDVRGLA